MSEREWGEEEDKLDVKAETVQGSRVLQRCTVRCCFTRHCDSSLHSGIE